MKQLLENIYMETIPLPGSPLKWINSYIITDGDHGPLIDTAFNHRESEAKILSCLAEVGLTIEQTDIFLTHMHVDHSGLCERLKRPSNRVFASPLDSKAINMFQQPPYWDWIIMTNRYAGVPPEHQLMPEGHVAFRYRPDREMDFDIISVGDRVSIGGYDFEVVDLQGHTPGQIGLYDREQSILFCGDHILDRITPNITAWDLKTDYLGVYLENLKRVKSWNVTHLFTSHRELPDDVNGRIDQLIAHHQRRIQEVVDILKQKQSSTAYEVARQMHWSIPGGFDEFPTMQKWFACSEALTHLQYLAFHGLASRSEASEPIWFSLI